MSGFPTRLSLAWSSSYLSRDLRTPPLEEDCTYLAILSRPILEKELTNLARYAWRASSALSLGATGRWEAIWSGQHRAEKK